MKEETIDGKKFEVSEEQLESYADLLEVYGYKVQRPPRGVKDEYTFDRAWNLYEKKVGSKDKLKRIWNRMSKRDRKAATEHIPAYVLSTPDKHYRLNFQTFLNQKRWSDELMSEKPKGEKEEKTNIEKLLEDSRVEDEETKRHEKRQRIYRMIEAVKENPESMMRDVLCGMYNNGLLKELNIDWKP